MANYSFALSDKLCREYMLFKQRSEDYDKSLVSKLLRYHTDENFVYNNTQIKRIGITLSKHLSDNLLRDRKIRNISVNELASKTRYKLILCDDCSEFPYVNINDDKLTTCLIGCFMQNDARDKAIAHIKSLCAEAKNIIIYDKHLNDRDNHEVLKQILPSCKCKVKYLTRHLTEQQVNELKTTFSLCEFETIRDTDIHHHDRYIIIDNKLEIMLSSGFEYLQSDRKDMSYIMRPITESRF